MYGFYIDGNWVMFLILAFVASVLICVMILPESKRPKLNSFFKKVADVLNFKSLLIEKVLKFLYIFSTIFTILIGAYELLVMWNFWGFSYYRLVSGLAVIFIVPVVIRLVYEGFMIFILLLKNTIDINKKMDTKETVCVSPEVNTQGVDDYNYKNRCPVCGVDIASQNDMFCSRCGCKVR